MTAAKPEAKQTVSGAKEKTRHDGTKGHTVDAKRNLHGRHTAITHRSPQGSTYTLRDLAERGLGSPRRKFLRQKSQGRVGKSKPMWGAPEW